MQWIIPITVLPGIALIVLSTSNLVVSLNKEITGLNKERDKYREIISLKLLQLRRLNWSLVLMYIGILIFLVSGVLGAITEPENIYTVSSMIAGVLVIIIAIVLLIVYGFKSIYIRERHLKI
jgi:quinol-cytochrome oxidoreductase complex cytochrome b subunit